MRVDQLVWPEGKAEPERVCGAGLTDARVVLAFADPESLASGRALRLLRERWPSADIVGCSTAGEICGTRVLDGSISATALAFDSTCVRTSSVSLEGCGHDTSTAGERLAQSIAASDLRHVFVFSDGIAINGSDLARGLVRALGPGVSVTGGLSADGSRFERTFVLHNDLCAPAHIVAVGLYGSSLRVGCGSLGGWDPFGPERCITRSKGNVLYELDGEPALDLYIHYLGEYARRLPSSGLLFPLNLRTSRNEPGLVRTILGIQRDDRSLTFAGDVPEGCFVRLMHASVDRLLEGATGAARAAHPESRTERPELAVLVSCVGRKLVLGQRAEEEVEAVHGVLGGPPMLGFYSYGELCPFAKGSPCELHNQTMTVTAMTEH